MSWLWWIAMLLPLIVLGAILLGILLVSMIDQTESSPLQTAASLECYHCGRSTPSTKRTCRHCGGELQ